MSDLEIETFIKNIRLQNPNLITLMTSTSVKLREEDLSNSKRLDLVIDIVKITSKNFHELALKTKSSFREKDREFFYQNVMICCMIFRTAFTLEWFQKQSVINWSNGLNENKHAWNNLLYKAIRVLMLDLGVELITFYTQLNFILIEQPSDWIFFIRMASQIDKYFLFKISQIEKIVFTGLEKSIEEDNAYKDKESNCSKYTKKVIEINQKRRYSLVRFYNERCQACFEDEFGLVTGGELLDLEKIEYTRNLADLRPLAYENELDRNLL